MTRFLRARVALLMLLSSLLVPLGLLGTAQAQSAEVYVALGDSIAAGVGSSLPRTRGYAADVASRYEQRFGQAALHRNLAVPGETASSFLTDGQVERFRTVVADATGAGTSIRSVSVSLGGNEMLALDGTSQAERQAGLDTFGQSYREALTAVRDEVGPETPIVVTTYYDLTDGDEQIQGTDAWWIEQFNRVIRASAADLGAAIAEVGPAFEGRIRELTLYPVDVHPSNAGHRVIADTVWAALNLDTTAPTIDAPDEITATRTTPTLRFSVSDDGQVASASVEVDGAEASAPVEITKGKFVVLVRLGDRDSTPVTVTITVVDDAGNLSEHTVEVTEQSTGEP